MEASGKRYIWHRSRSDKFRIWNLSDLHYMAKGCDENGIDRDLKEIADDPYSFWLGGGDMCDFIGHTDKRFDPDAVAEWISVKDLGNLGKVGMEHLAKKFRPIKHKCLGLLIGNHEKKYELQTEHEGLHHWLCHELGVPSLEYCALFDLVFCRTNKAKEGQPELKTELPPANSSTTETFRVFAHHGAGYAQTPGGKLNKLIQFMQSFRADLFFVGHVHDRVARREPALGADANCRKLVQFDRLGLVSGSYLKTYQQGYTSYGEMKGYRPTALGAAVAEITPETRHMEAAV